MNRYVRGLDVRHDCADQIAASTGWCLDSIEQQHAGPQILRPVQPDTPPRKGFAIVENRHLVRDCLSMYLASTYNIAVDGCDSVDHYLAAEGQKGHNLIIMGTAIQQRQIMLGQLSRLCRETPGCPVIVMIDNCDYGLVSDSLRSGARGVFPTSVSMDIVREAIGLVMAGGTYIPAEGVMEASAAKSRPATAALTAREEQVLALLKSGKQNKQIAYSLGLSEGTVKVHLHNMMKKLGTSNRTQTILAMGT